MTKALESRTFAGHKIEVRVADDGTIGFAGYATVYDQWYDVAGGPERGGWSEMITAGAAKTTLLGRPDVRLLVNHDGTPLARTRSGTLILSEDPFGLMASAPSLDPASPLVQTIRSALDRGDLDEMSFGFRVQRQEWNDDYTQRMIREYDLSVSGADVSIVTFPANPFTVAQLRAAAGIDELRANTRPGMSLAHAKAIATQIRAHAPA